MAFGEILRALLEEREMTQKDLAKQLHLAPSTLGSYIQGVREPDFETLKLLARTFGVTTDYLLEHRTGKAASAREAELLRIFRALSPEQQEISIEQCRVFLKQNWKRQEENSV